MENSSTQNDPEFIVFYVEPLWLSTTVLKYYLKKNTHIMPIEYRKGHAFNLFRS